jgi:hypothetical protein
MKRNRPKCNLQMLWWKTLFKVGVYLGVCVVFMPKQSQ